MKTISFRQDMIGRKLGVVGECAKFEEVKG